MSTPNVSLLRKTVEHITAHPEAWDQYVYICGTAACFAGRAVLIDGGRVVLAKNGVPYLAAREDDPADAVMVDKCAEPVVGVRRRARRILGLDTKQALRLFMPTNTVSSLLVQVDELIRTAGGAR
jgi:hypothetical protein